MNLNNIVYKDLFIEVTRRCNMSCKHCLRGNAQNLDIKLESIDLFLSKLKNKCFKRILFTGGEPSLNVEAIRFTLEKVKQYNIQIWMFEIITNGYNLSDEFVTVCNEWLDHCVNTGIVLLSTDSYHKSPSQADMEKFNKIKSTSNWGIAQYPLLNLGNAKSNNIGERIDDFSFFNFKYFGHTLVYTDKLLLTCTDKILYNCDYTFNDENKFLLSTLDCFSNKIAFDRANESNKDISEVVFHPSLFSDWSWLQYLSLNNLIL